MTIEIFLSRDINIKLRIFQSKLNKKIISLQIGKIHNFNFDTLRKMCHLDLIAWGKCKIYYKKERVDFSPSLNHDMAHGCESLMAYPCTILEEITLDIFL